MEPDLDAAEAADREVPSIVRSLRFAAAADARAAECVATSHRGLLSYPTGFCVDWSGLAMTGKDNPVDG